MLNNPERRPVRSGRAPLVAGVLSAIVLATCGCGSATLAPNADATSLPGDGKAAEAAPAIPPALVRVEPVRRETIAPRLVAVGTVRARNSSTVASGSEGIVDEFPVEQGDFVKTGQLLSRLRMVSTDLDLDEQRAILAERAAQYEEIQTPRQEDVEEARARLSVAEVVFANAQRRLDELKKLQQSKAAGESAVKDGEDSVREAAQNLVAAKAVFQRISGGAREEQKIQARARLEAQQKHVDFLEAEKEKRLTRAPFDGFVVQRHSYLGQWLSRGSPVVTLLQLDQVDVEVQVDQSVIGQVVPGKEVQLKVQGTDRVSRPSGTWVGVVDSVIAKSDWQSGSRSFPVVIRVDNEMGGPDGSQPLLREGMMAEAEFTGDPIEAVLVPKDSLVRTSRGTFLFAVNPAAADAAMSVRQVMVQVGISSAGWIQVLGTDLERGTSVVTEGAERLRAFQTIQILPEEDTEAPVVTARSRG